MTDTEKQKNEQTTSQPEYLDKDGKPIPFLKQKEKAQQKQGFKIGVPSFLGFVAVLILLASLTPFYSILMRITPASVQKAILKPLYRNISLGTQPQNYNQPIKMPIPEPGTLPILGFDTGICFSFYSTQDNPDPNYIDAKRLKAASRGKNIAEIIAIGKQDKYEYHLESTSYRETIDKDNKIISVICQKLGRAYGSTPKNINELYIRPIEPFKAKKTVWNSVKHLYDDYSSPAEPANK